MIKKCFSNSHCMMFCRWLVKVVGTPTILMDGVKVKNDSCSMFNGVFNDVFTRVM